MEQINLTFGLKEFEEMLAKNGLMMLIVPNQERQSAMAKEMDSYSSPSWDNAKKYSMRGDSVNVKYDFFLQIKENDRKEQLKQS